jgi:hypothetical protein
LSNGDVGRQISNWKSSSVESPAWVRFREQVPASTMTGPQTRSSTAMPACPWMYRSVAVTGTGVVPLPGMSALAHRCHSSCRVNFERNSFSSVSSIMVGWPQSYIQSPSR